MIAVNIRALTDLSLRFADGLIRIAAASQCRLDRRLPARAGNGGLFMPQRPSWCRFTEALAQRTCAAWSAGHRAVPRPVPSNFRNGPDFKPGFDSAILNVSAADVAQQAYRGLMTNSRVVLPGFGNQIYCRPSSSCFRGHSSSPPSAAFNCASADPDPRIVLARHLLGDFGHAQTKLTCA